MRQPARPARLDSAPGPGSQLGALAAHPRGQRVHVLRLVQRGHRQHGRVEQADQVGEGVAEEAGDAQGDVHPWAAELLQRQYLDVLDPLAAGLPHRAHAEQGQGLGYVVAAGAHGRRAPHRQAQARQVLALVLQVAFEQALGALHADAPGGGGGQVPHVHRIEIASGGQARPGARDWARRSVPVARSGPPGRRAGRSFRRRRRRPAAGRYGCAARSSTCGAGRPGADDSGCSISCRASSSRRSRGVAVAAPGLVALRRLQAVRTRTAPGLGRLAAERVKVQVPGPGPARRRRLACWP